MYLENKKITNMHLSKTAIVYIRQSSARQVIENNESTMRQYALKDKLIALGWPTDKITIIDQDLGKSGADASNRSGFQTLVGDVSNNLIGAVACIECSRLSRNSADWGRLTQYCAYTNTLLIDADGIYDPNDFNDRLLLGLKATMSEAELHFLQARMRGGLMNKAKRGELKKPIPVGYIYDDDNVIKDPDIEIQKSVEMVFDAFKRTGSAHGVVEYFKQRGFKYPYKIGKGFRKGEVEWVSLELTNVMQVLHNPYYAGVYAYGQTQMVWTPEGRKLKKIPREDWHVLIKDHHVSYITYDEYENNERTLRDNNNRRKCNDEKTAPREGAALIQGLTWCGKCGHRMEIQYSHRNGLIIPNYICNNKSENNAAKHCQFIGGLPVDKKISELLIARLTPKVIEQAVFVQKELDKRYDETLKYYQMRVDKCKYEAELARRRFMSVDPNNRLVALELESSWNLKLKALDVAQDEFEQQTEKNERINRERNYSIFEDLAIRFKEVFNSDSMNCKDKKRMVRYLIEDVTLNKEGNHIWIHIRYKGHTTQSVVIDAPMRCYDMWRTPQNIIEFIDKAAQTLTIEEISALLNRKGFTSGKKQPFNPNIVELIMERNSIANLKERYLKRGYITSAEKAISMGITKAALTAQIRSGRYKDEFISVNTRNECLFPPHLKDNDLSNV